MSLKCGIVGLPNVGKSTLFNALTSSVNAEASNYPFCTIEPNVGIVNVPSDELYKLAKIAGSKEILLTYLEFIDIAGLVKGASKGEGLGNKFLSHIKEIDCIIHVVRCFEDDDIIHVENTVDPIRDIKIIETELMLADLETVEKRIVNIQKKAKSNDAESLKLLKLLESLQKLLMEEKLVTQYQARNADEQELLAQLQLITSKKTLYVCNVPEEDITTGNNYTELVINYVQKFAADAIIISACIESDLASISDKNEQREFLDTLNIKERGLDKLIRTSHELLNLITFFTVGPKEARAWTIKKSILAPEAAGKIHTDFEKGFIRAETIAYDDYIKYNGEQGAKEAGKLRLEGKEYVVKDKDILHFRFNL